MNGFSSFFFGENQEKKKKWQSRACGVDGKWEGEKLMHDVQ